MSAFPHISQDWAEAENLGLYKPGLIRGKGPISGLFIGDIK